jgi:hypothetical protein
MHLKLVIMVSARMSGVEYFVSVEDVLFVVVKPIYQKLFVCCKSTGTEFRCSTYRSTIILAAETS